MFRALFGRVVIVRRRDRIIIISSWSSKKNVWSFGVVAEIQEHRVRVSAPVRLVVLDHRAFRERRYGFKILGIELVDQAATGVRRPKLVRQAVPGSVTLPARGKVEGLHPAIKNCAQVRTWLRRGEVSIVSDTEPAPKRSRRRRTQPEAKASPELIAPTNDEGDS